MSDKVMNFDQFSNKEPLEDPKTPITTPDKPEVPKETFVDQVKAADLTQPEITEPAYTETTEVDLVDENVDERTNLVSVIQTLETELNDMKRKHAEELIAKDTDLLGKKNALAQMDAELATKNAQLATAQSPTVPQTTPTATPIQPSAMPMPGVV